MNEQTLKKLDEYLKLINGSLTKKDFEESFKKVSELLVAMEKRNSEAIAQMQRTHAEMMKKMGDTHNENYSALKGQVDEVFVGEQVNRMKTEHSKRMADVRNGMDGKTPTKEELIALIKPLIPAPREGKQGKNENLADIREDIKQLKEDMKKQKSRVFGGYSPLSPSHSPIHQSFNMNGTDTSVTLREGVAAQGTAIFVRQNGQLLDLTTHYSVNGNKVTFTFTPAVNSIISVTYWP